LEHHIIDTAIDQWRRRLTVCGVHQGGHFEHNLYKTAQLAHRLIVAVVLSNNLL